MPVTTIPARPTFAERERVTTDKLNTLSTLADLSVDPVGWAWNIDADRPITKEKKTQVFWNRAQWNTTSAKPGTKTIVPISGLWRLELGIRFADKSTSHSSVHLRIDKINAATGDTVTIAAWDGHRISSTAWSSNHAASFEGPLNAGDQVLCEVTHYDASNLTLSSDVYGTHLRARYLGRLPN